MATLKRTIYGLPMMAPYRAWRTRTLARRVRRHPLGFAFAGSEQYFAADWEPREREVIAGELARADVFVDIGANQGIYTCLAASRGLEVAAVEPEAGNLRFLLGNIEANGFGAEVLPVALGNRPGVAKLFGDGDTASLVAGWSGTAARFAQAVPANTLDNLFADRWADRRVFIKMDVEGFELQVLEGAARMLARARPATWFIETFPRNYDRGASVNAGFVPVFETMFAAGYRAVSVDDGAPVGIEDVRRWAAYPGELAGRGSNYLFRGSAV